MPSHVEEAEELLDREEDDGVQLEPFNLAQERAEGFFDDSGHYVENKKDDANETDAWLGSEDGEHQPLIVGFPCHNASISHSITWSCKTQSMHHYAFNHLILQNIKHASLGAAHAYCHQHRNSHHTFSSAPTWSMQRLHAACR